MEKGGMSRRKQKDLVLRAAKLFEGGLGSFLKAAAIFENKMRAVAKDTLISIRNLKVNLEKIPRWVLFFANKVHEERSAQSSSPTKQYKPACIRRAPALAWH